MKLRNNVLSSSLHTAECNQSVLRLPFPLSIYSSNLYATPRKEFISYADDSAFPVAKPWSVNGD